LGKLPRYGKLPWKDSSKSLSMEWSIQLTPLFQSRNPACPEPRACPQASLQFPRRALPPRKRLSQHKLPGGNPLQNSSASLES
jgi:hypothetical protein